MGRAALLAALSALAAAGPAAFKSPAIDERSVSIEIDDAGGVDWRPWCGGLLAGARGPSSDLQVLTASHCVTDLAKPKHGRASLKVVHARGEDVMTTAEVQALVGSCGSDGQARALAMDYAFIPLHGTPAGDAGLAPDLRPRALAHDEPVLVHSGGGEHVCHVTSACGTQVELGSCNPAIVPGVSGSPAWVARNGRPLVAGIVTQAEPNVRTATMTSYTAILAKSSFLVADPLIRDHDQARSAFVNRYLGKIGYRLPRDLTAPHCQASSESLLTATSLPASDAHMFVGAAFGAGDDVVAWDRRGHRLCSAAAGRAPSCSRVDVAGHADEGVRGVTWLAGLDYLLRFDKGGALVVRRTVEPNGWKTVRSITAAHDPATTPQAPVRAITNQVEGGFTTTAGDLVLFGEGGLCVVEGTACRLALRPGLGPRDDAAFTVRSAFESSPNRIIAVGRDFGGQDKPRCAIYERTPAGWSLTHFCGGLDPQLRGLNAAIPLGHGALIFSSSGAALVLGQSLVARRIPVAGLLLTPIGASREFDEAVRAAGWIVPGRIAAIAGSDGAVHVLRFEIDARGVPTLRTDRCVWKSDLGLWLLAMDVRADRAAVVSQGGELNHVAWNGAATLDRFFARPFNGQCT